MTPMPVFTPVTHCDLLVTGMFTCTVTTATTRGYDVLRVLLPTLAPSMSNTQAAGGSNGITVNNTSSLSTVSCAY